MQLQSQKPNKNPRVQNLSLLCQRILTEYFYSPRADPGDLPYIRHLLDALNRDPVTTLEAMQEENLLHIFARFPNIREVKNNE